MFGVRTVFKVLLDFFRKIRELPVQDEIIRQRYRVVAISIEDKGIVNDFEEYERRELPSIGMSMLDIIACGLGAVTLIAVLHMIIKNPLPPPLSNDFILGEIRMNGSVEIGFAIKHDKTNWFYIYPNNPELTSKKNNFSLVNKNMAVNLDYSNSFEGCVKDQENRECEHTIARLYIEKPAVGYWYIEPYLFSYRAEKDIATIGDIGLVTCFYWTRTNDFTDTSENCLDKNPVSIGSQAQIHGTAIEIKK